MAEEPGDGVDLQRRRSAWIGLALLLALEGWRAYAEEPDYYIPDIFRPLSTLVLVVVLATALLPWRRASLWIRRVVYFLIASFLILEVLATASNETADYIEVTEDALLRYRYRPGADASHGPDHENMKINSRGLWDLEYAIPKPDDVYRVVLIGGSMGNDGAIRFTDRYHVRLQELLRAGEASGRRVETINVSCEGYNTLQQVRLLERVGIEYEPDLVIVAYQLSDPFLQNGAGRKVGNSAYLFRLLMPLRGLARGSKCAVFAPLYGNYGFELMVHGPLERLRMLGERHGFRAGVAILPVLERFDDPVCTGLFDQVEAAAADAGHDVIRVVDEFIGEPVERYQKPEAPDDIAHLNPAGHERVADVLSRYVRQQLTIAPAPPRVATGPTRAPATDSTSLPPSCAGAPGADLACGAQHDQDCCDARPAPGGAFLRSYDGVACTDDGFPAQVRATRLDTYEVTVGRFRAFLDAGMGTQARPPEAGSGGHPRHAGSGWDPAWNAQLARDRDALDGALACAPGATWTAAPGDREQHPINCVTWFEAQAFCAWDGGWLPTEAERNYVASGGDEQRLYPWSSPPSASEINAAHAVFASSGTAPVGARSPAGDGRWGHADLAGNVWEWTLDTVTLDQVLPTEGANFCSPSGLPMPCDDCVATDAGTARVLRGGGWGLPARGMAVAIRRGGEPDERHHVFGIRCARPPEGATGSASAPYPDAPHEFAPDHVLPNLPLRGLVDPSRDITAMVPLSPALFFNPTGASRFPDDAPLAAGRARPRALVLYFTTSAAAPPPLEFLRSLQGDAAEPSTRVLTVLVEGERKGQSADAGNLQSWVQRHGVNVPAAMDRDGALAAVVGAVPVYAIVDTASMRVVQLVRVAEHSSPQRAVAQALERVLG